MIPNTFAEGLDGREKASFRFGLPGAGAGGGAFRLRHCEADAAERPAGRVSSDAWAAAPVLDLWTRCRFVRENAFERGGWRRYRQDRISLVGARLSLRRGSFRQK